MAATDIELLVNKVADIQKMLGGANELRLFTTILPCLKVFRNAREGKR